MLMAFYLACIKKKKVLVIRRVKEVNTGIAVVFFDGQGSYSPQTNLSPDDLFAIRNQVGPATVLVDGFRQDEADSFTSGLLPFACLATSCQFDAKQDDNSQVVVLPAWREADLLEYAKSSEWVIETGLRKTTQLKFSTWPKLVQEQYFYSGGSLREFCRTREDVKTRVVDACATVKDIQAFQLVYSYGGAKTEDQVDRIRRHYIADCSMEEHYRKRSCWVLSVDSGYALTKLGTIIDTDKQLSVYDFAKCIGGGFHGVAYELLLHNAVRGAFTKGKPIVLKMREGSKYERIEIRVRHVVCIGENEAACYPCLSALDKDTYWYPSYPFFPFIDAVTTCQAFPSGSEEFDTIVAYLQVTVAGEKKFKEGRLRRLNEEMDKNPLLKGMKRAFVVVGPNSSICEGFILHDAPVPTTFLTMVSCFDPEQLKPEKADIHVDISRA
ncbi:hypothetical protein PR002_g30165 [Phytophthora rubi]|uniref:Uncharacterized protein n=3 Tax=Phytophthora TaxID=4783 RepID=A0A6A3GUA1_9STRA|nr:hypothetical protein PR002_g30165 [Phytophthora rubi]